MNIITSYLLVVIQFICIGMLLVSAPKAPLFSLPNILFLCGTALGLWAVFVMRKSKLQILPDVRKKATLIVEGPYKWIRHPMYTAVLLFCLGLLITDIDSVRTIVFGIILIDLIAKLYYEESLLQKHFSDYNAYKKKTHRLIPLVY